MMTMIAGGHTAKGGRLTFVTSSNFPEIISVIRRRMGPTVPSDRAIPFGTMVSSYDWLFRIALVGTAIVISGCASQRSKTPFVSRHESVERGEGNFQTPVQTPVQKPVQSASDSTKSIQVQQVAFVSADSRLDSEADNVPPSIQIAVQYSPSDNELLADQGSMSLSDFESLALCNNPTIAELVATTQKAAGFRTQVSLRANPTLGYNGTQIADVGTDQHTAFISQTIITADKLQLNRRVLNEALRAQLLQLEAQKYRVATDVRVKFYDALAAQRTVQIIRDFQTVADKGLELAELRKKALEGSQLDVVQAKVQKNEIDLALQQAEVNYQAAWRELVALAGSPDMTRTALAGELPETESVLDWQTLASTMIASSPEYQSAQVRVAQAQASLQRQGVQPIPNVDVNFGAGVDNGTNSGMINLQIGAPMPVFNKNQGNIAAARAELMRASREVQRIENSIKVRLATVSRDYDSSRVAVIKYSGDILPNADEGLKLAETAYKAGATSFVQVLVARRTYFDTNLQYIASRSLLAQARAKIDGYVLTGALDAVEDNSGDDSLRGLTFSQQ